MATYFRFRNADGSFVGFDFQPLFPGEEEEYTLVEASPEQLARHETGSSFSLVEGAVAERELPPPPPVRTVAPYEFRRRFTLSERASMTLAASQALDAGNTALQVALDDLASAVEVNLDDPDVRTGLEAFVTAGALTQARLDEVLA
jgi:hypothetical protein